jgi:histone acetyltransferase (RNA polymerase elongator complex component)
MTLLIIPVFIPHAGCPHKCAFCDQSAITGIIKKNNILSTNLKKIAADYLSYTKFHIEHVQISFYGGNFLGLKKEDIVYLLDEAKKLYDEKIINSIRFSTRPDTITNENLNILSDYPVKTIEIGVQSMDDSVLLKNRRGHTAQHSEIAARLIKEKNFELGMQIMTGLPDDSEEKALYTSKKVAGLSPDFVRIYPALVLKGSLLEKWYNKGTYKPFSLEKSVSLVKKIYLLFKEKNIQVIRMGLQASKDLEENAIKAGPYHPAFGHLVYSEIFFDMIKESVKKKKIVKKNIVIIAKPRNISKIRGIKNENINKLKKLYGLTDIKVVPDFSLPDLSLKEPFILL